MVSRWVLIASVIAASVVLAGRNAAAQSQLAQERPCGPDSLPDWIRLRKGNAGPPGGRRQGEEERRGTDGEGSDECEMSRKERELPKAAIVISLLGIGKPFRFT